MNKQTATVNVVKNRTTCDGKMAFIGGKVSFFHQDCDLKNINIGDNIEVMVVKSLRNVNIIIPIEKELVNFKIEPCIVFDYMIYVNFNINVNKNTISTEEKKYTFNDLKEEKFNGIDIILEQIKQMKIEKEELEKLEDNEYEELKKEMLVKQKEPKRIEVETIIKKEKDDTVIGYDDATVADIYTEKEYPIIPSEAISFEVAIEEISGSNYHSIMSECEDAGQETIHFIKTKITLYEKYTPIIYYYTSKVSGKLVEIKKWIK